MEVLCPVCGMTLNREDNTFRCGKGHCFDVARQGYVNLLTVDKKHAKHPGDTKEQVAARKTFLDGGCYAPIANAVVELLSPFAPKSVLDAGCGEGYYLTKLQEALPLAAYAGIDISKDAVRFAAVRNKKAFWCTGTAAALPFHDGSFDAVLSMFALTVAGEYARVLRPGGVYLQVIAGQHHLMGLKSIIYPEILLKEKDLKPHVPGFRSVQSRTLEFDFTLNDHSQVENLLSMTPHFWRISKDGAKRLAQTQCLQDRAQVVLNLYTKE